MAATVALAAMAATVALAAMAATVAMFVVVTELLGMAATH
jgi:hypothetical protein